MHYCPRIPCAMTTDGYCATCNPRPVYAPYTVQPTPITVTPPYMPGCICPPTSEKTCESPACPRKNHVKVR